MTAIKKPFTYFNLPLICYIKNQLCPNLTKHEFHSND